MYRDRKGVYHKRPLGVGVKKRESSYGVYIQDNKVLLVRPSWVDIWELPGGGRDDRENLIETLKREFTEETGYRISDFDEKPFNITKTKFYADDLDAYYDSRLHFFKVKKIGRKDKKLIMKGEIVDIRMMSSSDIEKIRINELHREIVENTLSSPSA